MSEDLLRLAEKPVRVHLRRTKGWRMPANTVKVDRTNKKFGNPFAIGCNPSHFSAALPDHCDTIEEAVACFSYYAETWMNVSTSCGRRNRAQLLEEPELVAFFRSVHRMVAALLGATPETRKMRV